MFRTSRCTFGAVVLLGLLGAAPDRALPKDEVPASPAAAMEQARPLLDAAQKAVPEKDNSLKAFKDNADGLRSAWNLLKGQSKEGLKQGEFQGQWNHLTSLFHYHGVSPGPEYQLEKMELARYPVRFGLPTGRGWDFREGVVSSDTQICGDILKTLPNGRVVHEIRIWIYDWNTLYQSAEGDFKGENAKGLAERSMAIDRTAMEKVTFRSTRIVTARMSRGFPKASFYEISGAAKGGGAVRRRNFYVKGNSTTFNFEVIEFQKTAPEDDAWTVWQTSGPDSELDAVVESFEEGPPRKK